MGWDSYSINVMKIIIKDKKWACLVAVLLLLSFAVSFSNNANAAFKLKKNTAVIKEAVKKQDAEKKKAPVKPVEKLPPPVVKRTTPTIPAPYENLNVPRNIDNKVVSGFGNKVPLIIALQQIAPEKYQFSFAGDIDPRLTVSWKGNKPWLQVLNKTLEKKGLTFNVDRDIILIKEAPAKRMLIKTAPVKQVMKEIPLQKAQKDYTEKAEVLLDKQPLIDEKITLKSKKPITLRFQQPLDLKKDKPLARPFGYKAPKLLLPRANYVWEAKTKYTLREVLTDWAEREGVELYWSIDYDYRINKYFAFEGNFATAVATLINRFKNERPQPYGQLHKGSKTPLVLVIGSYDLSH